MRVMLVQPFGYIKDECKNAPRPEIMDIDIVTGEKYDTSGLYYFLARFGDEYCYQAKLFAILPDEEPEQVTEEHKEEQYAPA